MTDRVILGAATAIDGVIVAQADIPATNDTDDVIPFGKLEMVCALGLTSFPFPKDARGYCEGFTENTGGATAVIIGARDTRDAAMLGAQLEPGDTALHSTGPNQAAQCQCKENGQAFLISKDKDKQAIMVMLDGENNKLQIMARGSMFEIAENGDITLMHKSGNAGLLIQADVVALIGPSVGLGGLTPDPTQKICVSVAATPAPVPCCAPPAPGIPVAAAMGVFIGK